MIEMPKTLYWYFPRRVRLGEFRKFRDDILQFDQEDDSPTLYPISSIILKEEFGTEEAIRVLGIGCSDQDNHFIWSLYYYPGDESMILETNLAHSLVDHHPQKHQYSPTTIRFLSILRELLYPKAI